MEQKTNEIAPVKLPNTLETTLSHINNMMTAFNLPRNVLASDEEIVYAWNELPREIMRIPQELRDALIVRVCVATSVGLFDGAVNYIWDAVILALRHKVENFGLAVVAQIIDKSFDEKNLSDMMDAQLLDLCYKLQLLSEEGYFFLNQCREIRNNFSSAHPAIAQIDDRELINFISRCCKYGLTNDYSLQGINIADFLSSIKGRKFDDEELGFWQQKLEDTFTAQRQLLVPSLMGIYCDPESSETTRLNSLKICVLIKDYIDEKTKSEMLDQYHKYFVKGDTARCSAARILFEKLKMLTMLNSSEQHSIVKNACNNLLNAHLGYNNFYNEPPFAERLCEITESLKTPESIQQEFVYTVLMGYVGNPYGISNAAIPYYEKMITNFSPREISYLLHLLDDKSLFKDKVERNANIKRRYLEALKLIDKDSMNSKQLSEYSLLIAKLQK